MAFITSNRKSLLSSAARVQAPYVKVTIGDYTFGVYDKKTSSPGQVMIQYPNYITSLSIVKVNGQVNQYTLTLTYPVRLGDDPNFFEKVFSSASRSRKIVFSYGDSLSPNFSYKEEEALITGVTQTFNLQAGTIVYTVSAVSSASLAASGCFTFAASEKTRPSDRIKEIFKANTQYGLQDIFTGMKVSDLASFIEGGDKEVDLVTKVNISPLDYIMYLVGCMIPDSSSTSNLSNEMYILTIHDETSLEAQFSDTVSHGPYFTVSKVNSLVKHSDAYELDIGFPSSSIVLAFEVDKKENFAIFYDYNEKLTPEHYVRRINDSGVLEEVYAPQYTSGNDRFMTRPEDIVWFTKMTKFPISATVKIQGLLRPATLMQYVRLNVVFPGGAKHISSGLYIVTAQRDDIGTNGYYTTLSLTRLAE